MTKEIMKKLTAFLTIATLAACQLLMAQDSWTWQGTNAGWTGAGGCSLSVGQDFLTMTVTGNQPHMQLRSMPQVTDKVR